MFRKIKTGVRHRYEGTERKDKAFWLFEQGTSFVNIAFGAAGAVKMVADYPELTASLTSTLALNSLLADLRAFFRHKESLTGWWKGVFVLLELVTVCIVIWAIYTYCKTTLDENSSSDAREEAAKWNAISAVIAFTVSPLVRKFVGFCAKTLEADRQQNITQAGGTVARNVEEGGAAGPRA